MYLLGHSHSGSKITCFHRFCEFHRWLMRLMLEVQTLPQMWQELSDRQSSEKLVRWCNPSHYLSWPQCVPNDWIEILNITLNAPSPRWADIAQRFPERAFKLGLLFREQRRLRGDMIDVVKIIRIDMVDSEILEVAQWWADASSSNLDTMLPLIVNGEFSCSPFLSWWPLIWDGDSRFRLPLAKETSSLQLTCIMN